MNSFYPIFPIAIHYIMAGSKLQASLSISIRRLRNALLAPAAAYTVGRAIIQNYKFIGMSEDTALPPRFVSMPIESMEN